VSREYHTRVVTVLSIVKTSPRIFVLRTLEYGLVRVRAPAFSDLFYRRRPAVVPVDLCFGETPLSGREVEGRVKTEHPVRAHVAQQGQLTPGRSPAPTDRVVPQCVLGRWLMFSQAELRVLGALNVPLPAAVPDGRDRPPSPSTVRRWLRRQIARARAQTPTGVKKP